MVYQEIIQEWFTQFKDDDDQISLDIDHVDEKSLRLSCGDGLILFTFSDFIKVTIASEGNDKFVDILVQRCKEAMERLNLSMSNKGGELKNVLMKFSELSKVMAANADDSDGDEYETSVITGDANEFDYQYENNKNDTPQVAGGVSNEWIEEYYMKKKWESKEVEIRASKGEIVEKQTDLHPGIACQACLVYD
jgi:hypothetical protein